MLKSYLKVAWRNLTRNRLISFINIFGLGLSMSVGLMIFIRVQDQLSYDNFHPDERHTYRVISEYAKKNGEQWEMASTPLPLEEKLKEMGGVRLATSIYPACNGKASIDGKEMYLNGVYTNPSFFNVFGFSFAKGNPVTALQQPNSIVLSWETAQKFFGTGDALGKMISLEKGENLTVTGVLNKTPGKSHIDYDGFASAAGVHLLETEKKLRPLSTDWYAFDAAYTYIVTDKNTKTASIKKDLALLATELNKNDKQGAVSFALQSLGSITPGTDRLANDIGNGRSSWAKLYFELAVGFIILLAACFNYTNLTIARALTRAKEVGVRKITGAKRGQVFVQYIIESVMLSLLAAGFAWVLLSFIIEYAPFNDGYEFIPSSFRYNTAMVIASLLFTLFTGILAGVAPAWMLSSFKPLQVLKNLVTAKVMGRVSIQKVLIVFQYSLSLTIIIFLLSFYRQFSFMSDLDPGFRRENVIEVPLNGASEKLAEQQLAGISGVRSVSALSSPLGKRFSGMSMPVWTNGKENTATVNYYFADTAFLNHMQLQLLAGSTFPSGDAPKEDAMLINQKMALAFGWTNYTQAIGQMLWINDTTAVKVTGVVKDFAYENPGRQIQPLALRSRAGAYNYLYVQTASKDADILTRINEVMKNLAPQQVSKAVWLEEELAQSNSQKATISLLGYLAFMAIAIASLGLLGLVMYTVEVKRKEISIRKIAGAATSDLVRLLSKGFIRLLLIAGCIAIPIGYALGFLFLQNFSHRVNLGISGALTCFAVLLLIGLATVISQTYRAAIKNPVTALRTE